MWRKQMFCSVCLLIIYVHNWTADVVFSFTGFRFAAFRFTGFRCNYFRFTGFRCNYFRVLYRVLYRVPFVCSSYMNHNIYWGLLTGTKEEEPRKPTGKLMDDIVAAFGSYDEFKERFTSEALNITGSGNDCIASWPTSRMGRLES